MVTSGFTSIVKSRLEQPQCVVCNEVLPEGSMKSNFLKRHLRCCHPAMADKDAAFFKRKEAGLKQARLFHCGQFRQQNQAGLRATYMVSLRSTCITEMSVDCCLIYNPIFIVTMVGVSRCSSQFLRFVLCL